MSHSKNLRATAAHLISAADSKLVAGKLNHQRLCESLRTASSGVYKATAQLQEEVSLIAP